MTTPPTDANRIALEQAQLAAARRDAFASHEDDYEDEDDDSGGGGGGGDGGEAAPTTTRSSNSSSTAAAAAATTSGVEPPAKRKKTRGRVKIEMQFIQDKMRRYTTFSKRKSGIMKKAYELSTLTGTQVLLLVASETGHVYTFATPKLQPMITSDAGKALIQTCLNSPDLITGGGGGGSGGGSGGGGGGGGDANETPGGGAESGAATSGGNEPPDQQRMSRSGFEETELMYSIADEETTSNHAVPSQTGVASDSHPVSSSPPLLTATPTTSSVAISSAAALPPGLTVPIIQTAAAGGSAGTTVPQYALQTTLGFPNLFPTGVPLFNNAALLALQHSNAAQPGAVTTIAANRMVGTQAVAAATGTTTLPPETTSYSAAMLASPRVITPSMGAQSLENLPQLVMPSHQLVSMDSNALGTVIYTPTGSAPLNSSGGDSGGGGGGSEPSGGQHGVYIDDTNDPLG